MHRRRLHLSTETHCCYLHSILYLQLFPCCFSPCNDGMRLLHHMYLYTSASICIEWASSTLLSGLGIRCIPLQMPGQPCFSCGFFFSRLVSGFGASPAMHQLLLLALAAPSCQALASAAASAARLRPCHSAELPWELKCYLAQCLCDRTAVLLAALPAALPAAQPPAALPAVLPAALAAAPARSLPAAVRCLLWAPVRRVTGRRWRPCHPQHLCWRRRWQAWCPPPVPTA